MLAAALLLPPATARACIWDSDTLAAEAKGLPDVVAVITGRFERNPPQYYERRLQRATADIQADRDRLDAYDDAGVACDRLGRGDQAIRWMERKRRHLNLSRLPARAVREHRYRYLANTGTFWAHRWFRAGADRRRLGELRRARDFIRTAIRLNPEAHFGRERYQLRALEWILHPPLSQSSREGFPNFLGLRGSVGRGHDTGYLREHGLGDAVRGLSGLIVLGNAWESVDTFYALSRALQAEGRSSVAYLARLRCEELIDAGRGSVLPDAPKGQALKKALGYKGAYLRSTVHLIAEYRALRHEADAWHAGRTAFMLSRLQAGRHPDTDPSFWAGFTESAPPRLSGTYRNESWLATGALVVALVFGAQLLLSRRKRIRAQAREARPSR
jgi:tetratricopeptide (TPR) repeat protein